MDAGDDGCDVVVVGCGIAGLYYRSYTGSTSVMRGAVFGRLAGLHAAGANRTG